MRVSDAAAIESVIDRLPPGSRPAASQVVDFLYSIVVGGRDENSRIQRFSLLYFGAGRLGRTKDLKSLLKIFESDLQLLVADNASRRTFVHAGVVGWNNQAVLIPGMSFSGKTTLVSKLVQAGAKYYSDEYAVIDEHGLHVPHPRMHQRAFVLLPLAEIAPGAEIPAPGKVHELLPQVADQQVIRLFPSHTPSKND